MREHCLRLMNRKTAAIDRSVEHISVEAHAFEQKGAQERSRGRECS